MVWVVDKKVVRHLLETDVELVDIPIRVKFEFELDDGRLVADSLKLETLYNKALVCKRFPNVDGAWLDDEVQKTVDQAIDEHLRMEGYMGPQPGEDDDPEPDGDALD
ncbi:MAG: hypothetical protein V3U43_06300 [Pseudomonadales bacterium]